MYRKFWSIVLSRRNGDEIATQTWESIVLKFTFLWLTSGALILRIAACDICAPKHVCLRCGWGVGGKVLREYPLEARQWDLDRRESLLPDAGKLRDIINEELSDSMSYYYGEVRSTDAIIRVCVWWGRRILEFIAVLGEGERHLCLHRIFATGFTPCDYSRYGNYSR